MSTAAVGAARGAAPRATGTSGRGGAPAKPPADPPNAGGGGGAGGAAGGGPPSRPTRSRGRGAALPTPKVSGAVHSGAGFVLGLLVWGWVVLPFLRGGMPEVRNVLRAKFLNKAPDGTWLP